MGSSRGASPHPQLRQGHRGDCGRDYADLHHLHTERWSVHVFGPDLGDIGTCVPFTGNELLMLPRNIRGVRRSKLAFLSVTAC